MSGFSGCGLCSAHRSVLEGLNLGQMQLSVCFVKKIARVELKQATVISS